MSKVSTTNGESLMLRRAKWLIVLSTLGLLLPLGTRLLPEITGTLAWLLDLASHWQWLYASGLVMALLVTGFLEHRWLVFGVFLPLPWLTATPRVPSQPTGAVALTVASINVHLDNTAPQRLIGWLRQERPDLVILVEVSPTYAQGLQNLADYPYRHLVADWGPFGLALLSRHPLSTTRVVRTHDDIPYIESTVQYGNHDIGVIAYHPMPPLTPSYQQQLVQQLQTLVRRLRSYNRPILLVGDLNATPWSAAFDTLDRFGLRRATSLLPTWPVAGQGIVGIPIDQILVTPPWRVIASRRGPDIGSDHYPVLAQLGLGQ